MHMSPLKTDDIEPGACCTSDCVVAVSHFTLTSLSEG